MNWRILRSSVLSASLTTVTALVTTPSQAQNRTGPDLSVPLFEAASCVASNDSYTRGGGFIDTTEYDISVGLKIYESLFRLIGSADTTTTLVCQADSSLYSLVNLRMAIPDSDASRQILITINVFQNGNLVQSYDNLSPGEMETSTLALDDGEDFAIQQVCRRVSPGSNCGIHFTDAHLITATSPILEPTVSLPNIETDEAEESEEEGSGSLLDILLDGAVNEAGDAVEKLLNDLFN